MSRSRILALALAAVVAGLAGTALLQRADASADAGLLPYTDAEAVALGRMVYADHCAACHGENLEGEPDWQSRDADGYLPAPPHDTTGHTWHHPDELLIAITTLGTETIVGGGYRSNMSGFADILTEDEILAVLAFIKSTWPERLIELHNEINERAAGG